MPTWPLCRNCRIPVMMRELLIIRHPATFGYIGKWGDCLVDAGHQFHKHVRDKLVENGIYDEYKVLEDRACTRSPRVHGIKKSLPLYCTSDTKVALCWVDMLIIREPEDTVGVIIKIEALAQFMSAENSWHLLSPQHTTMVSRKEISTTCSLSRS